MLAPRPLLFASLVVGFTACGGAERVPAAMPATSDAPKPTSSPHQHGGAAPDSATDSFDSLMHTAMVRMDEGMNVACTEDPDVDFAAMMVPHHQGAVDMALVELRYGKDERLRRLAEGIIVEQRQEIALMESILTEMRKK